MDYIVDGGRKFDGSLCVYGAKNCALACLAATLLTDEEVVLTNCPDIADVSNMILCLVSVGKRVRRYGNVVVVDGSITQTKLSSEEASLLRGSSLLLGPLVARCGNAEIALPGGCAIGTRPMDIHVDGLRALGSCVTICSDKIRCDSGISGGKYALRFASVGATENLVCASVCGNAGVVLDNCALEPEVVALCEMLVAMGANIDGVGHSRLAIQGVQRLHGTTFEIIPDRIVAATYIACALAAGGRLAVVGCPYDFVEVFCNAFDFGCIRSDNQTVYVKRKGMLRVPHQIVTAPFPGFHTDMQSLALSLAAVGRGKCCITENLFENRLVHNATQLNKMGGNVFVDGRNAFVAGSKLHGTEVVSADLRGGAALVVAALAAEGQTTISDNGYIQRGYCKFCQELTKVGARIRLSK